MLKKQYDITTTGITFQTFLKAIPSIFLLLFHLTAKSHDTITLSNVDSSFIDLKKRSYYQAIENYHDYQPGRSFFSDHWDLFSFESFALQADIHLLKIHLKNDLEKKATYFLSTFFCDSINIYKVDSSGILRHSKSNGYLVPTRKREEPFRQSSIVPLSVSTEKEQIYILEIYNISKGGKASSKSSFQMGFLLYSESQFRKIYSGLEYSNFFILGIVIIFLFYNLLIYIRTKELDFLFLTILNFALFGWVFIYGGMLLYLNIIHNMMLERWIRHSITVPLFFFGFSLYTAHFLNLKKLNKYLYYFIISLGIAGLLTYIPATLEYYNISLKLAPQIGNLIYTTAFFTGIYAFRKRMPQSGYFLFGTSILAIAGFVYNYSYLTGNLNYVYAHVFTTFAILTQVISHTVGTSNKLLSFKKQSLELSEQNKEIQKKLEKSQRELTSFTSQRLELNTKLEKVYQAIQSINTHNIDSQKNQISHQIKEILKIPGQWEQFKSYFEQVHPNFFKSLQDKYGQLTLNELRIAAFIKMRLSNKEIAIIQGVSVRAIEKARERLKKKLNTNETLLKTIQRF
jgi:hypothetical protein